MEIENFTPFPSIAWENEKSKDDLYVTFVSKVKLDIKVVEDSENLELKLSSNQDELNIYEVYHNEDDESSLRYDSDLITYKENTDVVLNAKAYAPFGIKSRAWNCGVKIFEPNKKLLKEYFLDVKAKKKFVNTIGVWVPKLRKKDTEVPIRYENAYGGTIKNVKDKIIKKNYYNPSGCGIRRLNDKNNIAYAPQIKYTNKLFSRVPPGFGFMGKIWQHRLKYIGTYNKKWLETEFPYLPRNFNYFYYQAAHPELIMKGYIKANTIIELYNLIKNKEKAYLKVPKFELVARLKFHTGELLQNMNLDTLVIDIDNDDETKNCVYASYRARVKKIYEVQSAQVVLINKRIKNG